MKNKHLFIALILPLLLTSCQSYPESIYDLIPDFKNLKFDDIDYISLEKTPGFGPYTWNDYYHYTERAVIDEYYSKIIALKGEQPPQTRIGVIDAGTNTLLFHTKNNTYSLKCDPQGLIGNEKTIFCNYDSITEYNESYISHQFQIKYYDFYSDSQFFESYCFNDITSFTFTEVDEDIKQEERFADCYLENVISWSSNETRLQPLNKQYFSITEYVEENNTQTTMIKSAHPLWYTVNATETTTKIYKIMEETDFLESLLKIKA